MAELSPAINHSLPMRQVWVDSQLPPALAVWLRTQHGVDAMHVGGLGLLSAQDPIIFATAKDSASAVIILTKDDDFQKLLTQHGPPPQIIWVRCGNVRNQELRRIVDSAWQRTAELLTAGESLVEIRRQH